MIIVLTRAPGSLFGAASRMEVGIKVPSAACAGNTHRVSPTSNFVRAVEGVSIMFTMQALAFDKLTSRRKYSEPISLTLLLLRSPHMSALGRRKLQIRELVQEPR
ncbi:hypothetical protein [Bradyrhizobium sp. USDA 3458]|uniref:hypothetical protein n=1 Tax=Bradyrhizobium sp. USDA 3458 TaxID=2591461 RepID=UPI001330A4D6|nr:hypothetical protein [Bradyrhizobium sp. USDA 3458]